MSEETERVVLGCDGTWGFAADDLTSPARAAEVGALTDAAPASADDAQKLAITELRVHGVSGSNGPTMLEHPAVVQVAGDSVTMFYRRWTPAGRGGEGVPWKLEAYSWGGLTENSWASAAWVLLAPFMLYNVAHFMLPAAASPRVESVNGDKAQRLSRNRAYAAGQTLLRLLAVAATVQFTVSLISIFVNTLALQVGSGHGHLPAWLGWFLTWSKGERVGLSMAAVAAVLAGMWLVSVRTANMYEARSSRTDADLAPTWPLTQSGFWKGRELVRRHRSLHAAAATAATALVLSCPIDHASLFRVIVAAVASLVLVAVIVSLCLPIADRHTVSLGDAPAKVALRIPAGEATKGTRWCQALFGLGALAFVGSGFTGVWPPERRTGPATLPGFTNFAAILLVAQIGLLVVLGTVVGLLARRARKPATELELSPFLRGHLTTLMATLAICLGGVFGAVVNVFAGRLVGAPIPSGIQAHPLPGNAVEIPWPIYAFSAAPLGLLVVLPIAATIIYTRWRANVRRFSNKTVVMSDGTKRSPVAIDYDMPGEDFDGNTYATARRRVAKAWAVGLIVDQAAIVAAVCAAGLVAATGVASVFALTASHADLTTPPFVHGLAAAESLVGLVLAGLLAGLLRSAYSNPSKRKTIGALWDVATFWPRATHPFAPPCYAERAVPELVDRIRILTGTVSEDPDDPAWLQVAAGRRNADNAAHLTVPTGPVLLTGYSQGSIIAPAVIAQLPNDTRGKVALLTLACPARRLYGRAFPNYFGECQLDTLRELLRHDSSSQIAYRWKNLVRRSDYIGSWIRKPPLPNLDRCQLVDDVDQPCWDPVTLAADLDPTPPFIHRHSSWWQDPRVTQLGRYLAGTLLTLRPLAVVQSAADAPMAMLGEADP